MTDELIFSGYPVFKAAPAAPGREGAALADAQRLPRADDSPVGARGETMDRLDRRTPRRRARR